MLATWVNALYSWKFTSRSHDIENWAANNAKSMMSEGSSALLPKNIDRWLPSQWGLMNFQLQNFQLYNKTLKCWSLRKRLILFPSNLNVSLGSTSGEFSGNKINYFSQNQSLSVYYYCVEFLIFFISTFHQRNQLLSTLGLQMELFRGRCCCIRATCINYNLGQKYRENWTLPCLVSK